jgi:hypothetical protein
MPFSLHVDPRFVGDVVAMNWYAGLFSTSAQLPVPPLYPPLAYYTMRFFQVVLSSSLASANASDLGVLQDWIASPSVFRQLFLLKVWYLLFDMGATYVLWRLFRHDQRKVRTALLFWLFNPILIYGTYLHGQFDIVPALFTVLALYSVQRERPVMAALFLGIAACYKNYAFLLLPTILIPARSWSDRIKMLVVGTVPYLLLILPRFTEYQGGLAGYADVFSPAGYDVGFGGRVYLYFVLYALLLWYLHRQRARSLTVQGFWRPCFATLLIYYSFSRFDPHYWVWVIPFAAVFFVEHTERARAIYLAIGLCMLGLSAPIPVARYFAPVGPSFFLRLPSALEWLTPHLPMIFLVDIARSLLVGTCLYLAWIVLRGEGASRGELVQEYGMRVVK